jgi:hypothetical protein
VFSRFQASEGEPEGLFFAVFFGIDFGNDFWRGLGGLGGSLGRSWGVFGGLWGPVGGWRREGRPLQVIGWGASRLLTVVSGAWGEDIQEGGNQETDIRWKAGRLEAGRLISRSLSLPSKEGAGG